MQGAVLRDTRPRKRNRLVILLLLPVLAVVWLIGWSLTWAGSRKDAKPKNPEMRREDHVTLVPAVAVNEQDQQEEEAQVKITT
jgi:flagellar basal body-associated protein FliL